LKTQNQVRKVQVVSALGQQVKEFSLSPSQAILELDLSAFQGVYFLRITLTDGEQALHKVIIR
jgi:hypothetical protein